VRPKKSKPEPEKVGVGAKKDGGETDGGVGGPEAGGEQPATDGDAS
jgi:hypothetical protein